MYRGYRYDTETGLYYLNSRYYNSEWGRFINADATAVLQLTQGELLSHNLFAYGMNDPVNNSDENGYLSTRNKWIIGVVGAAVVVGVIIVATGGAASPLLLAAKSGGAMVATKACSIYSAYNAMKLSQASVFDKLTRYLLNLNHSDGKSKAKWFRDALGYTQNNMNGLGKQIVFNKKKAVLTKTGQYGLTYEQTISIKGANGRTINVVFVWLKSNVDGVVRLVTSIPTKK